MNYVYFKSKKGNFGDDLNAWLWPQLFKGLPQDNTCYFLGIGSILHHENESLKALRGKRKIVFGTGIRPSKTYTPFKVDNSWDIRFLRGPLSAQALDNQYPFITDAAYALRLLPQFGQLQDQPKKYDVSVMPYFHSVDYFNWEGICKTLGYHYISPYSEQGVEHTMREIASSRVLLTEAMHGAIVADILRVPWSRFIFSTPHTEGAMVSEFKWADWLQSVDIIHPTVTFVPFYQRTKATKWISKMTNGMLSVELLPRAKAKAQLLERLSTPPASYLSSDSVIREIDRRMAEKLEELLQESTTISKAS